MIHILFTADQNYAVRIPVVVKSIHSVDPKTDFHIHLISDTISEELKHRLGEFCCGYQYEFSYYTIADSFFQNAPVNKHYSKAMYYRMLAHEILPKRIEKILYLDPDILVINSLLPLWSQNIKKYMYAAASHIPEQRILDNIYRIRLETSSVYYNTGVLLMNLGLCRQAASAEQIYSFIDENGYRLLLPDQDVFNALYGNYTLQIPDEIWNYDARKYTQYYFRSNGQIDENWVIRNTSILHYCGKEKPWNKKYKYRFGNLYRHYENLCVNDGWNI